MTADSTSQLMVVSFPCLTEAAIRLNRLREPDRRCHPVSARWPSTE